MTSKSLPRDPTPAMIEAALNSPDVHDPAKVGGPRSAAFMDGYQAAWDAAPSSLPLKRTDPPTTSGLYWARRAVKAYRKNDLPEVAEVEFDDVIDEYTAPPTVKVFSGFGGEALDKFEWYGPVNLPEVEP